MNVPTEKPALSLEYRSANSGPAGPTSAQVLAGIFFAVLCAISLVLGLVFFGAALMASELPNEIQFILFPLLGGFCCIACFVLLRMCVRFFQVVPSRPGSIIERVVMGGGPPDQTRKDNRRVLFVAMSIAIAIILFNVITHYDRSPVVKIAAGDIPYSAQILMHDGDAIRYQLPNGKIVAVWCHNDKGLFLAEQRTASGLKTSWGEASFRRTQPSDSYIQEGDVITTGDATSEYILFVEEWRLSITEDLKKTSGLPVTIRVVPRGGR